MRNKKTIGLLIALVIIITLTIFTYFFSNIWLLLTDQGNYIPKESNIFFFHPTKIDDGSGGYWRYGEDLNKYYYFSETEEGVYYTLNKNNSCQGVNKLDYKTWCEIKESVK